MAGRRIPFTPSIQKSIDTSLDGRYLNNVLKFNWLDVVRQNEMNDKWIRMNACMARRQNFVQFTHFRLVREEKQLKLSLREWELDKFIICGSHGLSHT